MLSKLHLSFTLIFCCLAATSCTNTANPPNNNFIVLNYSDFGPQGIAEELIGPSYWQWDSGHYSRPQEFDIKVIVYRDIALDAVKDLFPVSRNDTKDFRYVSYQVAVDWYDKQIEYFEEDLASDSGDKNISFYFLRNLYVNLLKIERALRK